MQTMDLFTGGQAGYHTYRIPALAVALDGTVLAFCEARLHNGRDDDQINILLRRSFDGGHSWEPPQTVITDGERTCGNPCPVVDRNSGAVVLPFCKDNQQIFVTRSFDHGVSWETPVEITDSARDAAWSYVGTGPGHGIQLTDGRLLIPSWADESPGPVTWSPNPNWGKVQSSYAFFSDDGGASWQCGAKMTTDTSDECMAVETAPSQVYMNMRSRHGKKCRAYARSDDGGATWSEVAYEPEMTEPSCQGSILKLEDGTLLQVHPTAPEDRTHLQAHFSDDGGHTWPRKKMISVGPSAYSDLALVDGGTVLCLYEADHCKRLALMRLEREWAE
jgi:sialidase-1